MHSDRRGNRQKAPPDKTFQTKDKILRQNSPRTIEREFVQGAFVRGFVLGLLKIRGGGPRCVTYFLGGHGMCDSVTEGGQNRPKIVCVLYGLKVFPCHFLTTKSVA